MATTVFIANLAIQLPSKFKAGDVISDLDAKVLNNIQLTRIKAKLRWLLSRGEVVAEELQRKAIELSAMELLPYATLDDDDAENDPVLIEALSMAREIIVSRMAQEGLPPPKGLEAHAKALVDGMPALQEKARLRIEARYKAANLAIEQIEQP